MIVFILSQVSDSGELPKTDVEMKPENQTETKSGMFI